MNPITRNNKAIHNISYFLKGDVLYPRLIIVKKYQGCGSFKERGYDHSVGREEQLVHGDHILPVLGEVGGVVVLPEVPDSKLTREGR